MTATFSNEYSALSPFVALIQQIVDGTISETGVGATTFASLGDKDSVNLPVLNAPLAIALTLLASKATADAHYANVSNPHSTSPAQIGAQATLVSGTNIKSIGGVSILGSGDIPAVSGATAFSALSDKVSVDLPLVNTPLGYALAGKVPVLPTLTIGAGAIALTSTNANRANVWTGSTPQTVAINPTGGALDDLYCMVNQGTADITMPGIAASGYKLTIVPNAMGVVQWRGGTTFLSWIPSGSSTPAPVNDLVTGGATSYASAQQLVVLKALIDAISVPAAASPVTVTGSTVNGSVLTRTLATGWTETGGNWTRDGTNISGATSSTYTTVSGDGTHTVTWKSATIPFLPPGIAVAAAISYSKFKVDFSTVAASTALNGLTPNVDNTEGNTISSTLDGAVCNGSTLPMYNIDQGAIYTITSGKAFTFRAQSYVFSGGNLRLTVRDTGEASGTAYSGYQINYDRTAGTVRAYYRHAGSIDADLVNVATTAWTDDAPHWLAVVMDGSDMAQIQIDGTNVGSPFSITGSNYTVRLCGKGNATKLEAF